MKIKRVLGLRALGLCVLSIGFLTCTGCTRLNRPPTCEEEAMVKSTLDETSPRALNDQPKAIPEFRFKFGGPKRSRTPLPADEITDTDVIRGNT